MDRWFAKLPTGRVVPVRQGFRFATVDFAASTRSSADWTVCAVWCQALTGELVLLDLWRGEEEPELHWDFILPLGARGDAKLYVEASQFGTDLVYAAGREGWALDQVHPDSDKYTRALPAARRVRQGRVFFPAAAHWLDELVEELCEFPNGRHDDQVDVVAYAHRVVSETWLADPGQTGQDTRPDPAPAADPYGQGGGPGGTRGRTPPLLPTRMARAGTWTWTGPRSRPASPPRADRGGEAGALDRRAA